MRRALLAFALVFGLGAAPTPQDRLADPAQEARARELFKEIRCVVCQNESIDDSDADLAADLRREVRSEIAAGRSDREILAGLTDRYGEFIRMRPTWSTPNLLLWLGPLLVVVAGAAGLVALTRRRSASAEAELTPEEERRLREIVTPPQV
jgi:cytochrome c-type biogenesis protein CcmH